MNENEIIEEWKPICGYDGLYEVSNLGRVKSLCNEYSRKEKILKQIKMKNGYLQVNLCKEGKMKHYFVHRLVANAFIENTSSLPCVNHIDENKTNNCVDNLEWCTYQYNLKYGTAQQRRVTNIDWKSIRRKNAEKLTNGVRSKQVYQYSLDGELVAIWQSIRECGRNGFNFGAVADCCNNCFNREGNNIYKDYKWSYYPL